MLPENYKGATPGRACRGFISTVSLGPTADEIGNWDPTISCHMNTQCLWHELASWVLVHNIFKHSIHPWGRDQPLSYYTGFEKDKAFLYMGPSWKQLSPTTIRKASPYIYWCTLCPFWQGSKNLNLNQGWKTERHTLAAIKIQKEGRDKIWQVKKGQEIFHYMK